MARDNIAGTPAARSQRLADAALSCLLSSDCRPTSHKSQADAYGGRGSVLPAVEPQAGANTLSSAQSGDASSAPGVVTIQDRPPGDKSPHVHALIDPLAAAPRPLPSLLRYVDHDLMQNAAIHNHPPDPNITCPVCLLPWNNAIPLPPSPSSLPSLNAPHTHTITSTFLPLSPCGHWIHYHCLIRLTTHPESHVRDKCFVCRTPLFEWEGITALTLATRTNLSLKDCNKNGSWHLEKRIWIPSDTSAYESDCALIVSLISQAFFAHLQHPKYADGSPDLVSVYYNVMNELERTKRPTARWLAWTTQTGSLLLGMLVVLKMRRFLIEGHVEITRTQAWEDFEEVGRTLQSKILEEINRTHED